MKLNIPEVVTATFTDDEISAMQEACTVLVNMIEQLDNTGRSRYEASIYEINKDTLEEVVGYMQDITEILNCEEVSVVL